MGFQLLYYEYLRSIKHPMLKVLDASPQSFVGEDVELSLMLMSNYSATTNLNRCKTLQVQNPSSERVGEAAKDRERVTFDEFSPEVKHSGLRSAVD